MSAKVLVIEDNQANLELAQYLLQAAGHKVLTAMDGRQGMAVVQQETPDLIVCDLQMPVLDGYGVLQELRADAAFAAIPIVAVTAFSMPGDQHRALNAGFNGYISKPIEPDGFVAQLEQFLPETLRALSAQSGND